MHRPQIVLEEWQYETLKARAKRSGQTVSELVQTILSEHLAVERNVEVQTAALQLLESLDGIASSPQQAGNVDERLYRK